MINRLSGKLIEKAPPQVVLDVNGVAYEIDVPMTTFYQLPALGEWIFLYTHLVVREDAHLLFGFASKGERETFRQLIRISGIGARIALAILSGMTVAELAAAIANDDTKRLSSVPGIGKKTAERLVLELRGKRIHRGDTTAENTLTTPAVSGNEEDILNALMALGYSEKEAIAAMKGLASDISISDGIRLALKGLLR